MDEPIIFNGAAITPTSSTAVFHPPILIGGPAHLQIDFTLKEIALVPLQNPYNPASLNVLQVLGTSTNDTISQNGIREILNTLTTNINATITLGDTALETKIDNLPPPPAETDPIFVASPAYGITTQNKTNWNTAFGWGSHAGLYRPIGYVPSWSEVSGKPTNVSAFTNDANYVVTSDVRLSDSRPASDVYSWAKNISKPIYGISEITSLQAALDSKATPANISAAISALVNSSPTTLDTLNELAVALGNDPNFATTIATALGGKEPVFSKNTAFNKNFGTIAGTVTQGNDSRLTDSRTASDVYAWAKNSVKPTYTYSEVGAAPSSTVSYTDTLARNAISLTTTGTTGAATYTPATGVLNIPQYSGGSGMVWPGVGIP